MEMFLISVIVPIYNAERFLTAAVDSVLAQTYKDWELIFINDGSTDQSGTICDQYADRYKNRIRVIHQNHQGLGCARNVGLSVARGRFVIFVDANDVIIPEYLEQMCIIQRETNADMVVSSYARITPRMETVIHRVIFDDNIYPVDTIPHFIEKYKEILYAAWGKLLRKSLVEISFRLMGTPGLIDDNLYLYHYATICKKMASMSQLSYYRWEYDFSIQKCSTHAEYPVLPKI